MGHILCIPFPSAGRTVWSWTYQPFLAMLSCIALMSLVLLFMRKILRSLWSSLRVVLLSMVLQFLCSSVRPVIMSLNMGSASFCTSGGSA